MTHVPATAFTELEFALLNRFQRDFPLVPRPFAALAQALVEAEGVAYAVACAGLWALAGRGQGLWCSWGDYDRIAVARGFITSLTDFRRTFSPRSSWRRMS